MSNYDLIIAGAGMAGLSAARAAAEDGLKVLVVETKKDITEINRACSSAVKMQPEGFITARKPTDVEITPVMITVEVDSARSWLHFRQLGFSVEYTGPLRAYHNKVTLSPSGHRMYMYPDNNKIFAYQIDKEVLTADMLKAALKAGAEIRTETAATNVENTPDGARLTVQSKTGQETLEASKVLAADGVMSRLVESLGLNSKRRALGDSRALLYAIDGLETGFPESMLLNVAIPSISKRHAVTMGLWTNSLFQVHIIGGAESPIQPVLDSLMAHPNYAGWFRNARVIRKMACSRIMRTPIPDPVCGNVFITGDACSFVECSIKGTIGTGYKAAKCIAKSLAGQDGEQEYIYWWQHAHNFNSPQYLSFGRTVARPTAVLTDAEIDDLYKMLSNKHGLISDIITDNMELIKQERPDLYEKLKPAPAPGRPARPGTTVTPGG